MEDCKSTSTPILNHLNENVLKAEPFNSTTDMQAIEILIYMMLCARPVIAFAVSRLSQCMEISNCQTLERGEKSVQIYWKDPN